jgi:cell division protein FtsL
MDAQDNHRGSIKSGNKLFLAGILIAIISLCIAGAWIQHAQKQARSELEQLESKQKAESEQFQAQLNEANSRYLAEANRVNAEMHDPLDPDYLVNQLYKIDNQTDEYERNSAAFYCLQGLLLNGTNSLPAIKKLFINGHEFNLWIRKLNYYDSLRQEIMQVLVAMKNQQASDLLSQLLPVTQSPKELGTLCKILLSISDGYRPYCVKAAREMYDQRIQKQKEIGDAAKEKEIRDQIRSLNNQNDPKNEEEIKRLYELRSKISGNHSEILSLINIFIFTLKDKDFVNEVMSQKVWRQGDGEIEYNTFNMAKGLLKEEIIPYCYEAALYQQENHKEINFVLLGCARDYIAQPHAAEILLMNLKNDISPRDRYNSILELSLDKNFPKNIGQLDFKAPAVEEESKAVEPEIIQKANERLVFLDTVAAQFGDDEFMMNLINLVRSNLRHTASTDPDKGAWVPDEAAKEFIKEHINDVKNRIIDHIAKEEQELLEKEIKRKQQ